MQYIDTVKENYTKTRLTHWNNVACERDNWRGMGGAYHHRLSEIYRFLISPGQRVLEIGCAEGNLLASLQSLYRFS